MLKRILAVLGLVVLINSPAGSAFASNPNGSGGDMPAYYDGQLFTINFNPGFQPVQLTSDTEVLAAAASGEITLTDTDEFYRCSVVGHK